MQKNSKNLREKSREEKLKKEIIEILLELKEAIKRSRRERRE